MIWTRTRSVGALLRARFFAPKSGDSRLKEKDNYEIVY